MPKTDPHDERWEVAIEAIDEALDSDDPTEALQAAIAWALVDIADSLDVLSQVAEGKSATDHSRRPRSTKTSKPKKGKGGKKRAPKGADEEDE